MTDIPALSPPVLDHDWFPRPLPANVTIGENTWLHSAWAFVHYRSTRREGVRIGRHCGVYIETYFDLGPRGEVVIGDYCTLNGPLFSTNGRVEIGNDVLMSLGTVIADTPFATPVRSDWDDTSPPILIADNAWIGARSVILSGAVIGQNAIVAAGAVVDFEVPPGAVVAGNPASIVA